LRGHVTRVQGIAVGVNRILSAANEQPRCPSMSWAWSNPKFMDQDRGLIGLRSMYLSHQLVVRLMARSVLWIGDHWSLGTQQGRAYEPQGTSARSDFDNVHQANP
jgi:hypothetical protein